MFRDLWSQDPGSVPYLHGQRATASLESTVIGINVENADFINRREEAARTEPQWFVGCYCLLGLAVWLTFNGVGRYNGDKSAVCLNRSRATMGLQGLGLTAVVISLMSQDAYASCEIYPIHSLAHIPYQEYFINQETCRSKLIQRDSDGDGIADWSDILDQVRSSSLVAKDEDIDGDGWTNILDPEPFDPLIQGEPSQFPDHLLYGPNGLTGGKNAAINRAQVALWRNTGLVAINTKSWHSSENLQAIADIWHVIHQFSRHNQLRELKYIIADDSIRQRGVEGYYSKDLRALIISTASVGPSASQAADHTKAMLAHELGHAFVFSSLKPKELLSVAQKESPWKGLIQPSISTFYAPFLFQRHWLFAAPINSMHTLDNVPSPYALQNIHEWFAECFASALASMSVRSNDEKGLKPVSSTFRQWLVAKLSLNRREN